MDRSRLSHRFNVQNMKKTMRHLEKKISSYFNEVEKNLKGEIEVCCLKMNAKSLI
jgi:hypothetical protein